MNLLLTDRTLLSCSPVTGLGAEVESVLEGGGTGLGGEVEGALEGGGTGLGGEVEGALEGGGTGLMFAFN